MLPESYTTANTNQSLDKISAFETGIKMEMRTLNLRESLRRCQNGILLLMADGGYCSNWIDARP